MKKATTAILLFAGILLFSGSAFALEPWHPDKAKPDKVLIAGTYDQFMQTSDAFSCESFFVLSVFTVDKNIGESIVPIDGYFGSSYSYGAIPNTSAAKHETLFTGRCEFY